MRTCGKEAAVSNDINRNIYCSFSTIFDAILLKMTVIAGKYLNTVKTQHFANERDMFPTKPGFSCLLFYPCQTRVNFSCLLEKRGKCKNELTLWAYPVCYCATRRIQGQFSQLVSTLVKRPNVDKKLDSYSLDTFRYVHEMHLSGMNGLKLRTALRFARKRILRNWLGTWFKFVTRSLDLHICSLPAGFLACRAGVLVSTRWKPGLHLGLGNRESLGWVE